MVQPVNPEQSTGGAAVVARGNSVANPSPRRVRSGLGSGALLLLMVGMAGLAVRLACLAGGAVTGPKDKPLETIYHKQKHTAPIPLLSRRGNIYDCRGRLLAGSVQVSSVYADPTEIQDIDGAAAKLAPLLDLPAEEIAAVIRSRAERRFVWLKRRLEESQADAVRALKLRGIVVQREPARAYPMGSLAGHVLGFVGSERKGLAGVELQYDEYLRGEDGYKICIKDAAGRILGLAPNGYKPPRDGCDIYLSIDSFIQMVAEKAMEEAVAQYEAEGAVAIVSEPSTGQVLAMVSRPGFDPNFYNEAPESALRNRALTGPVEPGSIFKPMVAAVAVQEAMVRPGEMFNCYNGVYVRGSRRLRDVHGYSALTFEQVVGKSSNIGMAQIGERLGNHMMHHYLTRFGFGSKTGIDLPGEDVGILLPLRRWTSFSTNSIPMGQEISVTSIQMIAGFNTILNGGTLLQPTVVRAVVEPGGQILKDQREPRVVRRVIDEATAKYMTEVVLAGVINEGTGTRAKLARWQVVGKTGTAQIAKRGGGGYEPDAYVGSFVCGAPASDPKVSVAVMIHRPKKSKGYYGGTIAAPPAAKILSTALDYLGVPDDPVLPGSNTGNMLVIGPGGD